MSFSHSIPTLNTDSENIIVPQGMFLNELKHALSVGAFGTLAANEGKKFDLNTVMPAIQVADRKVKAGGKDGYNKQQFIDELRHIFALEKASDDEICKAWNKMLGDLSKIGTEIDELRKRHPNKNFILMSGTSPLHMEAIIAATAKIEQEQKNDVDTNKNPLQQCGLPLYVSFLQAAEDMKLRMSDTNLIEEIMADKKLDPKKTLLLVSLVSTSSIPAQKQAEEAAALARKNWAEDKGFLVADFRKGVESVSDAIDKRFALQLQQKPVSPRSIFSHAALFSTSTAQASTQQTSDTSTAVNQSSGASSPRFGSSEHAN
jgi:hypothetical protein